MRWFARRSDDEAVDEAVDDAGDADTATRDDGDDQRGPWDVSEVPDLGGRVDLGALRVPARSGMKIRMELERTSGRIIAVNLGLGSSALQVQAFAAPRSAGLWEELRGEIAASIEKQGGTAQQQEGAFGPELLARLPVRTPDGRTGARPARFIGIDGPRWFVRGVLTGEAASDPKAAEVMEQVLADLVVVRGHEARAPRDLLTLHMPGKPGQEVPQTVSTRPTIDLGSPRGPEITEVR